MSEDALRRNLEGSKTVLVGRSTISGAGLGCFGTSRIDEAEPIVPALHEAFRLLSEIDIPRRYLKYCVRRDDGRYLAPESFEGMGPLWFVNHQREPNCSFLRNRLYAARRIEPGEELTVYYSDLLTHPCNRSWVRESHIREG